SNKKPKTKTEQHQRQRNFCEHCQQISPDVEFYNHRNPTVSAKWICAPCADKNQIADDFRTTNQSDFSKKGIFRREFGPLKRFSHDGRAVPTNNQRVDGNKKSPSRDKGRPSKR
ncbi:MAG: hypothetical protein HN730_01910, partial [Bdellovibrionales bacterium]|nr:hypothetical protein [Bdellovibrionales bacterium]